MKIALFSPQTLEMKNRINSKAKWEGAESKPRNHLQKNQYH